MAIATPNDVDGATGGYCYNFVEPPQNQYLSTICLFPSREPQMTCECCNSYIFCKSCLNKYKEHANQCPFCGKKNLLQFQMCMPIKLLRNYIYIVLTRRKAVSGRVNWVTLTITLETVMVVSLR